MGTKEVFDAIIHGERECSILAKDEDENVIKFDVELVFDPNAELEYFTSNTCIHDGTLLFIQELMEECVKNVAYCATYNKNGRKPESGDTIKYTVGNFVVLNEYDGEFVPSVHPWLRERTTVLLPIKMEVTSRRETI